MAHARGLVRRVCTVAGTDNWIEDLQVEAADDGIVDAVAAHDTAAIFDWLIWILSFQGISDAVAKGYMDRHGSITWEEIEWALANDPGCTKLQTYWTFTDCRYQKGAQTCSVPREFKACPLPQHLLRNGRLAVLRRSWPEYLQRQSD